MKTQLLKYKTGFLINGKKVRRNYQQRKGTFNIVEIDWPQSI